MLSQHLRRLARKITRLHDHDAKFQDRRVWDMVNRAVDEAQRKDQELDAWIGPSWSGEDMIYLVPTGQHSPGTQPLNVTLTPDMTREQMKTQLFSVV